jgi:hypothetical protein
MTFARHRPWLFVVLAPAIAVGDAACSSTNMGETPDAASDAGSLDQAAPGASVWSSTATGFELTSSGGFVPADPDGSVCHGYTTTWRYDVATRRLSRAGCAGGQPIDLTVVLTPTSASDLAADLSQLKAKGPKVNQCGADYPEVTFTVLEPGGVSTSYDSDFYSGCAFEDAGGRTFIAYQDLGALEGMLYAYSKACPGPDGGTSADAGATCAADAGP